jgi:hypothetical protein
MQASCSLQSELSYGLWDLRTIAGWLPFVRSIVVRV